MKKREEAFLGVFAQHSLSKFKNDLIPPPSTSPVFPFGDNPTRENATLEHTDKKTRAPIIIVFFSLTRQIRNAERRRRV
jgi:hypothetical protein